MKTIEKWIKNAIVEILFGFLLKKHDFLGSTAQKIQI